MHVNRSSRPATIVATKPQGRHDIVRPQQRQSVRSLPLFHRVSEAHFAELMDTALLQRFPEGVTIIQEGDLPDFLHIVVGGMVELFARHDGHETTLDIIEPGSTFILAAVVRDETYLKSARTLTSTQLLMIPAGVVRSIFGKDAAFARAIVEELAERYRCVVRALKNEKLRTSAQRLANWVLQEGARQGNRHEVTLKIDKRTLASRLGMTPENLSRNLGLLARHGLSIQGPRFIIDDAAALRIYARPNALIDDIAEPERIMARSA
ncbi:MAG TPA: cyclic nucleotide-binding domain-containing protein [Pseudolabrys sp.]|jgi:CRP/FNR family transcriptional activator FtrB|nr:cyclic nucleotide-binding domain-containing protein [Pseudolabrys sp.]